MDWTEIMITIIQRFRRKASRLIESHLDNRMTREVMKDREGNYPEMIVHATALQTVILLLKAHDPNNEVIEPFKSELDEILDGLKSGSIVLPSSVTADSSKGVIGTSTYSVWVKDSDTLKNNQVITAEKITGDYDHVVSGLYIRWSGDDVASAITTDDDEYEIEVHSSSIDTDISSIGSVSMTRR